MQEKLVICEKEAKSILSKSGISGVDYAVNPYTGCSHNCVYCYASFMKRFSGHLEPWGTFVDAKVNAPELLRAQLRRAPAGKLMMSSVTDCYQPLEKKHELTRRCIEALLFRPDMELSILTKSSLVTRDIDLLKAVPQCSVGFTITSASDKVSRILEPGATPASARFAALQTLRESGMDVWAFFGPVVPYFADSDEAIEEVFRCLENIGLKRVHVDRTNLYPAVKSRLQSLFRRYGTEPAEYLQSVIDDEDSYAQDLRYRIGQIAAWSSLEIDIIF
jgi:DNA repair photolyase